MPIYEYHCDSCDSNFEAIRKFSDAPLTECRKCGAAEVRKLLSAPAFRLKGGGWYETDFKSGNQRNVSRSDSDSGGSKESGGKESGGKESGSKESGSKESGSKESGSKGSGSGSSAASGSTSSPAAASTS
jgi:putative FmdB family regulatory protein